MSLARIKELLGLIDADASSNVVFELVELYLAAGMLQAALDAMKNWSFANPGSDRGRLVLAQVYLQNGLFDDARSLLQHFDPMSLEIQQVRLTEIRLEVSQGHQKLAEKKLESFRNTYGETEGYEDLRKEISHGAVLTDDENDTVASIVTPTMADLFFRQGLVEKALPIYRKLLEKEPGNSLYSNRIKQILGEKNNEKRISNKSQQEQHQVLTRWLSAIQCRRSHV